MWDQELDQLEQLCKTIKFRKNDCCDDPHFINDLAFKVCINCGQCANKDELIDYEECLNPKYKLSTCIGFGTARNTRSLHRIHKWNNYEYKENTANTNYNEIEKIGLNAGLNDKVITNACYLYKDIYIIQKISSRNKIKRSIFVHCLYQSAITNNIVIDPIQILEFNKLSVDNYNKGVSKINQTKLYLHSKMNSYIKKLKDNHYDISLNDLIITFNNFYKLVVNTRLKLNNHNVLICAIYDLINPDNDKIFFESFNVPMSIQLKFKILLN